jgi:HEXXH motif-containing protein
MQIADSLDPSCLLPPFDCSLPAALRISGEQALLISHALTRHTYSTGHFLSGAHHKAVGVPKVTTVSSRLLVEANSPEVAEYAAQHGLELAGQAEVNRAAEVIHDALVEIVESIPCLQSAISELAWRCHIVVAPDDDYDVSFSDPAIPFSIFVSVPARKDRSAVLRVAESLVHEAMHLQLSLFERLSPLVDTASHWSMYSPWKHEMRPAQGMLHGLYVFCILRWLWRTVSQTAANPTDTAFALGRVSEIDREVSSLLALRESPAFTDAGKYILHRLFGMDDSATTISNNSVPELPVQS